MWFCSVPPAVPHKLNVLSTLDSKPVVLGYVATGVLSPNISVSLVNTRANDKNSGTLKYIGLVPFGRVKEFAVPEN